MNMNTGRKNMYDLFRTANFYLPTLTSQTFPGIR